MVPRAAAGLILAALLPLSACSRAPHGAISGIPESTSYPPNVVFSSTPEPTQAAIALAAIQPAPRAPRSATGEALSRYYCSLTSWDDASMEELLAALRAIESPGGVAVGELLDATEDMEEDPFK
jgi:hypothetical protein